MYLKYIQRTLRYMLCILDTPGPMSPGAHGPMGQVAPGPGPPHAAAKGAQGGKKHAFGAQGGPEICLD